MKFTIIFLFFSWCKIIYSAKIVREVIPQKYENCQIEKLPMKVMINPIGGFNSVKLTGYIEMTEDYNGDLHATIDANKCDFEMKNCLKYNLLKIENLCSIFTNKIGMFSMAFNSIKPPLKCPLKVGNHTLMDTQLDLTIFSVIPLDGAVWVANFKLIGTNGKSKKTIMCWNTETTIIKAKSKS